jgi:hypothetical protein
LDFGLAVSEYNEVVLNNAELNENMANLYAACSGCDEFGQNAMVFKYSINL